jgi:hypothetical protein
MRAGLTKVLILNMCISSMSIMAEEAPLSEVGILPINKNQKTKLTHTLNFSTKTANYSEGKDTASQVQFGFSPILKFEFSPSFVIDADTTMNLSSSRVQSRYNNQSNNNFILNELSMNYLPVDFAKLSLGALNQNHLNSPFLVSGVSFPGIAARVEKKFTNFTIGYKGQNLIPTSTSLDSDRTDQEKMPGLVTQGVFANYKLKEAIQLGGQINLFNFSNLPSIVAFESKRLGNSVTGIASGDSHFENEFSGISASYYTNIKYNNSFEQNLSLSIVENGQTSSGNNRAQMIETNISYKTESINFIPGVGVFYAEPDVSPAYYNTGLLGHNNRQGLKYSLRTEFNKMNLAVEASYVDSKVINTSVYQDDLTSVELVMEMLNVKF